MNSEDKSTTRFSPGRLALTLGIVWGLGLGLLGAVTTCTETYGHRLVEIVPRATDHPSGRTQIGLLQAQTGRRCTASWPSSGEGSTIGSFCRTRT